MYIVLVHSRSDLQVPSPFQDLQCGASEELQDVGEVGFDLFCCSNIALVGDIDRKGGLWVADEAGVELNQEMEGAKPVAAAPVKSGPTEVEEDGLGERLRALRS